MVKANLRMLCLQMMVTMRTKQKESEKNTRQGGYPLGHHLHFLCYQYNNDNKTCKNV